MKPITWNPSLGNHDLNLTLENETNGISASQNRYVWAFSSILTIPLPAKPLRAIRFFHPRLKHSIVLLCKTCFSFRCQKTCSRLRLTQSVEIPSENKVAWIFAITAHIVVSAECRVILQWKWEQNLGTQAGVHVIERVRLIWGPLNTSFTVVVLSNRNRR